MLLPTMRAPVLLVMVVLLHPFLGYSVNNTIASTGKPCWTECSKTCGGGMQITCANNTAVTRACNIVPCPGDPTWTKCTLTCGGGTQSKVDNSSIIRTCNTISCPGDAGCLSAYLSFEHVYNNIVYDESHNGNAGTMHGCARIVNNGKFGKALELSTDGNVTFDVENFHNRPTDAITIALWLNVSSISGAHELFFTCGTPELYNMGDYHFEIDNGKVRWFEEAPGGSTRFNISSNATLESKKWFHIAGTYRASTGRARLYINGALTKEITMVTISKRAAIPAAKNSSQAQWKCANLGSSNSQKPLQGIMDEFRIFKCELLPEEIMDLYSKNTVKRFGIPDPVSRFWTSRRLRHLDV